MCDIEVVAVAPCQCLVSAGQVMTSPGRISTLASPSHCVQPKPAVTINVWPQGWVCHAERAPGSNVTSAPPNCAGPDDWNSGSTRTLPVKFSTGPLREGREP